METAQDILARAKKEKEQESLGIESASDILARANSGMNLKEFVTSERESRLSTPREDQDVMTRIEKSARDRFGDTANSVMDFLNRDLDTSSLIVQIAGNTAAVPMDAIGEILIGSGEAVSNVLPEHFKDNLEAGAKKVGVELLKTDLGRDSWEALRGGMKSWLDFKDKHPVMAKNVESMVNIGAIMGPVQPGSPARGVVGKAGRLVERSGQKSEVLTRRLYIEDLVRPRDTVKELEKRVPRTIENSGTAIPKLSPIEQQSAEAVARVPGVGPKNTFQGNYNRMQDYVTKKASALKERLARLPNRGQYDRDEFKRVINDHSLQILDQYPELVGDAGKSAERVINHALKLADESDNTLADLLQVRRDLDNWVLARKKNVFNDDAATNAMTTAVREVRTQINEFIHQRARGVGVRESLKEQSLILRAMDDVVPKAARQANTRIGRAIQNAIKVIPIRNEIVAALGLMFGLGGLGAAATFLPFIQKGAIIGGIGYLAGKAVISPKTRKGIGKAIQAIEKGIKHSTNPQTIDALRADRAALLQILKDMEEGEPEEE
jgi:hypothetical protein